MLGYVTPWNSRGYDLAKTFAGKFSAVSPVWLQIEPTQKTDDPYVIKGLHDKDSGWMKSVRERGPNVKIIPRVIFDKWSGGDYVALFGSSQLLERLAQTVAETCRREGFDGVVLEVWSQLGGQARHEISTVIQSVCTELHRESKTCILVIPPPVVNAAGQPGMIGADDFDRLVHSVDFFSLMTYDYSNPQRPGPNSPIGWVRKCIETLDSTEQHRHKILLGLNFYGFDYTASGGGHIIQRDYLDLLRSSSGSGAKIKWDSEAEEHFIELKDKKKRKHTLFYPTLMSIRNRLLLAEQLGTGISVWEIGQGLDYFF